MLRVPDAYTTDLWLQIVLMPGIRNRRAVSAVPAPLYTTLKGWGSDAPARQYDPRDRDSPVLRYRDARPATTCGITSRRRCLLPRRHGPGRSVTGPITGSKLSELRASRMFPDSHG